MQCSAEKESCSKKEARKLLKKMVQELSKEEKKSFSEKACKAVCSSEIFTEASAVLLYSALPDETDTSYILNEALKKNKKVFFPKVLQNSSVMDFYNVKKEEGLCNKNEWNILEPDASYQNLFVPEKENGRILVVVPGTGFKKDGARLGHGKAYYDTYLKRLLDAEKDKCHTSSRPSDDCELTEALNTKMLEAAAVEKSVINIEKTV